MAATARKRCTILVIGEGGIGKSCLTLSFLKRGFSDEYDPTVEDEFSTTVSVNGQDVDVEIIDSAGQEEYRGLWAETHVRRADGFITVFDLTNRATFESLPSFFQILRNVKSHDDSPSYDWAPANNPFCFALLGNKSDLPNRQVSSAEGLAFARQGGGLFFETSAKQGVNVDQAFTSLVGAILKYRALESQVPRSVFTPNYGLLETLEQSQRAPHSPTEISYDEKTSASVRQRKKRKDLQLNKNASRSIGGLGMDEDEYRKREHGSGCCTIA